MLIGQTPQGAMNCTSAIKNWSYIKGLFVSKNPLICVAVPEIETISYGLPENSPENTEP
jgi:hypothetical protein